MRLRCSPEFRSVSAVRQSTPAASRVYASDTTMKTNSRSTARYYEICSYVDEKHIVKLYLF